jgi:hypothetical protein
VARIDQRERVPDPCCKSGESRASRSDRAKGCAYPVSVDLLLVTAWRRLRSGETKTAWWCWFLVALTASLGANAGLLDLEDAPAWLRILVAGWPAVAFLGGTLLAHGATNPGTDPVTAPEPPSTAQAPEPITADVERPTAAPELPVTAPESASPPPPSVPPALVTLARKVADEHGSGSRRSQPRRTDSSRPSWRRPWTTN